MYLLMLYMQQFGPKKNATALALNSVSAQRDPNTGKGRYPFLP